MNIFDKRDKCKKQEYCLIGLNKFNLEVGKILVEEGHQVTVIDHDPKKIDDHGNMFDYAIVCDATNLKELSNLSIEGFDYVSLGITNMGASVITTTNLIELGVTNILCKAKDKAHKKILKMLGVQTCYIPEEEIATKVAYKIMHDMNVDSFSISGGNKNALFIKVSLKNAEMWEKQVREIDFLKSVSATVISLKRKDGTVISPVDGSSILQEGDTVCLICNKENIVQIKDHLCRETN